MNFLLRASRAILLTVALMSFAVSVAPVHAAPGVRANVTYQARLMDASGYPVADGVYQVEFSLYDAPVAGTRLWTADGTVGAPLPVNVTVQDGLFTVLLGDGVTQLPFGDINWNSDSLYLGVTIGADGEMSPRRPITAVPQAINSAQLSGMSPSSTDTYGGESQFTILQASTTAATSTRSALDVRSNGTSVANDFILRAITNAGSPAFTITSQGVVSTTNLLVTGQNVCLADGTNCIGGLEADTLATVTARGPTTTVPLTFFGGATTSLLNVTSTASLIGNVTLGDAGSDLITVGGRFASSLVPTSPTGLSLGNSTNRWDGYFENTTATIFAATFVSSSQLVVAGQQVCLANGNNCLSATTSLQMAYDNGRFITLDDGRIQFEGVTGAQDEFNFNGLTATPILGAGYAGATNTGFDLSLAFNGTSGTFFSFTDNRNDPGATVNTSYLVHIPGNDNTLLLGNATSFIQFDNDIVDITNGSNEIFLDQGQQFFTADSDITGDTPFYFQDIGSQSSLLGLSNSNGLNLIHLGSDINPNGVYIPEDSGDLLIRSGSTGGAGTQLYVNVDGTDTGWRGVATTDMLAGSENLVSKLSENLILGDSISYIDVEGRMAFVIYSSGEWGIVDVTEPDQMVETYHQFGSAVHGQLVGRRLYVVDSNGFVEAYDFSDPTNANFLGDLTLPDPSYANNAHIVVDGSTMYFASDNYFVTIDVRDPAAMAVLADSGMPPGLFEYTNIVAQDGIVYFSYKQIGNPDTEIAVFNLNDPTNFDGVGSGLFTSESQDDTQMAISDNRFYIKRHNGAEQVIDVYRTTNGMVDFGGGPLTTFDPSGDAIDHFEVYRGRVYVAAFIEGSTQKLFETFTANFDGTYSPEQLLTNAFQTSDTTSSPAIFTIEGAFAYGYDFNGVDQLLGVVDLGGMNTRSLRATNGDFGQLTVANDFTVRGTANFTNGITVDGRGVCLSDGANCLSNNTSNIAMESHAGGEVTLGSVEFIDVEGRIAIAILADNSANIYDASWPADQMEQSTNLFDLVTAKLAGNRLYALDIFGELTVYDISDFSSPNILGSLNITSGEEVQFSSGAQLAVNGSVLYLTTTNTVRTIDIRNPSSMSVLDQEDFVDGTVTHPHAAYLDGFLYFAHKEPVNIDNETTVITAYDVRDPNNISNYDDFQFTGRDRNDTKIAVYNHKIYFQQWNGLQEYLGIRQLNAGMFGTEVATIEPPTIEIGHFEVSNNNVFISGFNEGGPEQNILYTYVSNGNDYDLESTMVDAFRTTDTDDSPENFDIEGTWLIGGGQEFIPGEFVIFAIDLGGLKTRSVFASGGDFGDMIVGNKLMVQGSADFANGITVQGRGVCLSDGTGCQSIGADPIALIGTDGTGADNLFIDAEGGLMLRIEDTGSAWLYEVATREDGITQLSGNGNRVTGKLVGDRLFLVSTDGELSIRDVSDPSNPVSLGPDTSITGGEALSFGSGAQIEIEGGIAYFVATNTLRTIDVSDPSAITVLDSVDFADGDVRYPHIAVMDGILYFASKRPVAIDAVTTLYEAYDVQDPSNMTLLGDFTQQGRDRNDTQIAIMDRKIYSIFNAGGGDELRARSVATGFFGASLGGLTPPVDSIGHFEVYRGHVYLSGYNEGGLQHQFYSYAFDGNDYTLEQTINGDIGTYDDGSSPANFDIDGSYLYADAGFGFASLNYFTLGGFKSRSLTASNGEFGQVVIGDELSVQGFANFANGITVDGRAVCLADGTNCPNGSMNLQEVYNNGTGIETWFGPMMLSVTSTSPDYVPFAWLDIYKTITSEAYNNDGISLMHGSGTMDNQHFVHFGSNISGDPFAPGSSWLMGNTVTGNVELYADADLYLQSPLNQIVLQGVTTTFQTNLVMDGTFIGSDLTPFASNRYSLGTATSSYRNLYTSGTHYFVNATGARLDLMASTTYTEIGSLTTPYSYGGTLYRDFIIGSSGNVLGIIDAADPENLRVVSTFAPEAQVGAPAMSGNYGYSLAGSFNFNRFVAIDFSNPAAPVTMSTTTPAGTTNLTSIQVEGRTLYVGQDRLSGSYMNIYDISSPSSPVLVTSTRLSTFQLNASKIKNGYIYERNYEGGDNELRIYNARNPLATSLVSTTAIPSCVTTRDHEIVNHYVYFSCEDRLLVFDVSNVASPTLVSTTPVTIGGDLTVDGTTLYLQNDFNYINTYDITSSTNPVLFNHHFNIGAVTFIPNGKYGYVFNGSSIDTIDLGGLLSRTITAGGADFGAVKVQGDTNIGGSVIIGDGLTVGEGGFITYGGFTSVATSTTSTFMGVVSSSRQTAGSLFVGLSNPHSQANFAAVISYASSASFGGLCVDDTGTGPTCPTAVGASIMADGAVQVSAFDLAELYMASGTVSAGDLVMFSQGATATVEVTQGMAYDPRAIGVISTRPGFVLGWEGDTQVALAGRVPVRATVANGMIRVGDKLTSSNVTGTVMKATRPGMTVGIALQDSDVDGMVEMFVQPEFSLSSAVNTDGSIQFVNENGSTTFSVDAAGNGYFLGGVSATSFNTHAAFDLAEQYTSPDKLEAGDLVMISQKEDLQMIRTSEEGDQVIGIVSSAPGFTLGASVTGSYPIALAGRVPTKVTNMNGDIERGDALMASSIPGVAQKATNAGQIIGYALQAYAGKDNGLIEVFVQPGYWTPKVGKEAVQKSVSDLESGIMRQGFAKITSGGSRVSVKYTSILAYPVPQVTAMGNVSGGWWLEKVSDVGFDIVMDTIQPIDIQFAWQVSPAQAGIMQYHSDGTYGQLDPLTGELLQNPEGSVEEPVVEESAAEVAVEGE